MIRTTTLVLLSLSLAASVCAANGQKNNLIPNPELAIDATGAPAGWKTWAPREALAADARIVKSPTGNALFLGARNSATYGKWVTIVSGVEEEKTYQFQASYQATGVRRQDVSIAAILSWCGGAAGEEAIQRDYAEDAGTDDGWRQVARTIKAPKGTKSAKVELSLRWSEGGSVIWKDLRLIEVEPKPHRLVKVATTRIAIPEPWSSFETNLGLISKMLDKVGEQRPDIVLFSENLNDRWVNLPVEKRAQPIPGPYTRMLSEKARKYGMYVATSMHEDLNGALYNTGILIDRKGKLVGKYHKVHLALEEGEMGFTPGSEYPVFETDFGKVGLMICYDYWFPEPARLLRLNGAEVVLLPIAGDGDRLHWDVTSRSRAIDNGVYLVTSSTVAESSSAIIAPTGKVLAETSDDFGVAVSEIDLDREYRLLWLSVGAEGQGKSLYVKERHPHTYGGLTEEKGK